MKVIPFPEYPRFSEQVALDGVIYNLFFDWNDRGSYWTMSITGSNNETILASLKIVPNFDIHSRYAITIAPSGAFAVYSRTSNSVTIQYNDFSTNKELVYLSKAELSGFTAVASAEATIEEVLLLQEVTDTINAVLLQEITDEETLYQEITNG